MQKVVNLKCNRKIGVYSIQDIAKAIQDIKLLKGSLDGIIESIENGIYKNVVSFVMQEGLVKPVRFQETHNIIPNGIRYELAKQIAGVPTPVTFEAKYIALGDSTTPPMYTDTQLGNETIRGEFTNRYTVDNVAFLDKFFTSAEVSGNTYFEAGVFCDGSLATNSGYLLSKIEMDETIGANEVLTINCSITINSAT